MDLTPEEKIDLFILEHLEQGKAETSELVSRCTEVGVGSAMDQEAACSERLSYLAQEAYIQQSGDGAAWTTTEKGMQYKGRLEGHKGRLEGQHV